MTRPTREEVDSSEQFLRAYFHQDLVLPRTQVGGAVEVALAEVRALREELAAVTYGEAVEGYAIIKGPHGTETSAAEDLLREFGRRGEVIARIEALSAAWRDKARQLRGYDVGMHEVEACADELDAALKLESRTMLKTHPNLLKSPEESLGSGGQRSIQLS